MEAQSAVTSRFAASVRTLAEGATRPSADPTKEQERLLLMKRAMRLVESSGLDAEELVRQGLIETFSANILVGTLAEDAMPAPQRGAWRALMGITEDTELATTNKEQSDEILRAVASSLHDIHSWAQIAPIDDVILMNPPDALHAETSILGDQQDDHAHTYRWLWHRTTGAELTSWETECLHLEWRNINERLPEGVPADCVTDVNLNERELNSEISRRAVRQDPAQEEAATLHRMSSAALRYLSQGKHESATAILKYYVSLHPADADALNNLGFCLIPGDAEEALRLLELARRHGFYDIPTNTYNRVFCLTLMNQLPSALDAAEYWWNHERSMVNLGAHLWSDFENPSLVNVSSASEALVSMAEDIAKRLGKLQRVEVWQSRRLELPAASQ